MKINVCSFSGFRSLDGSNLRLFHLTNELIRRGHDLDFIVPGKEDAVMVEKRFGVRAKEVGLDITRFNKSRLKLYPRFAWKAKRIVDRDADVVFGQSLPSALAVRLSKTRGMKIIDYVDLWSEYWLYANSAFKGRLIYRMIRRAESFSLKADLVFTITEKIMEMLEERGCNPETIRIFRDGVDTRMFRPMKVKQGFYERYGLDRSGEYVIYQGGIGAHDGVQFLVNAAQDVIRENPEVRFLIVGRGDYLDRITDMVKKRGLESSFIFTGWVPYDDMPSFMNISRLNVVPLPDSPATHGVVTLKLFEAMACGVPTVIGDLPGVREHIRDKETGYLVRSENGRELASTINSALIDRDLYTRIRRNGLEMIPRYDWREIARDMADSMAGA